MNTPELSLMCGFPASGKSSYLRRQPPPAIVDDRTVILCPDDFRLVLTGQQFHGPAEDIVWSHVKTAARILLRNNHSIIIDATHLTIGSRASWIRIGEEISKFHGQEMPILCIWCQASQEIILKRNKNRDNYVPEEVMQRMFETFIEPTTEEGFQHVISVNTETSGEQWDRVSNQINELAEQLD